MDAQVFLANSGPEQGVVRLILRIYPRPLLLPFLYHFLQPSYYSSADISLFKSCAAIALLPPESPQRRLQMVGEESRAPSPVDELP